LIIEEKRRKIEEIQHQKLTLQLEIEETSQTLKQFTNFENAYKDNINRLNETIFNFEKNNKNYEINLKNLKFGLNEIFKEQNISEIDKKMITKVNEINLHRSHEELIYIIKSFVNEYLKSKDQQNYYAKEKKALEIDIVNLKVEKDIYKEYVDQKTQELEQIQEVSAFLKDRITTLEEENNILKSKSSDVNNEALYKLQEEIINLNETVREKDHTIDSLNGSIQHLNEKLKNLERNNHNLERSLENLSRYEKYCEMLQQEKVDLQKLAMVLFHFMKGIEI
jgi:chromosome segregation ATPase